MTLRLAILFLALALPLAAQGPQRPPEPKPMGNVSRQWYLYAVALEAQLAAERAIVKVQSIVVEVPTAKVVLTWDDNSDNEAGFIIERSTDGRAFQRVAEVAANVTTFTDAGLGPGTYWYRVRAYVVSGPSNTLEWMTK